MGQEYYVFNEEYPANFNGTKNCRWIGESVRGSRIVVSCEDISLASVRPTIYIIYNIYISTQKVFYRQQIAMETN